MLVLENGTLDRSIEAKHSILKDIYSILITLPVGHYLKENSKVY